MFIFQRAWETARLVEQAIIDKNELAGRAQFDCARPAYKSRYVCFAQQEIPLNDIGVYSQRG